MNYFKKISLSSNIIFTIIFFCLIRLIDADVIFKGFLFIFITTTLIYIQQKRFNNFLIIFLSFLILFFIIFNEKKEIKEISSILNINDSNELFYEKILGKSKYGILKSHFLENERKCSLPEIDCFDEKIINQEIVLSPDQFFFNINKNYSRKVNNIKFKNLVEHRASFTNTIDARLNYHEEIYKLDTPYFVKYSNLDSLDEICSKGFTIYEFYDAPLKIYNNKDLICFENKSDLKNLIGLNYENNNLEIKSNKIGIDKYFDDFVLFLFFILVLLNIDKKKLRENLKLFIPILASILIIFYISRFDLWFNVFNLYSFYFFGFEGGDGLTYSQFANNIFNNFIKLNFIEVIRGGEDNYFMTPGFRYVLFINQLISGDFYYFYFYILFFLPKIINKFLNQQFGNKVGLIITLSFLIFPVFHHLGFSFYQYIRHAYRLYPEAISYMFFINGLYLFFLDYKKKFFIVNLLFALSVFLRPNLILSVILITLFKIFSDKKNMLNTKNILILILISIIYIFPLFHNLYFANSFTLFTTYGSDILSIDNIVSKDKSFYIERFISINTLFISLIFIPKVNIYYRIILLSQYFTLFWFDNNGRYYWIFWLVSLIVIFRIVLDKKLYKWKYLKNYISI